MTLQMSVFSHQRAGECAGTDKEYRQKVRSLSYNLRDATNPELRARVLQGEVKPDRLVLMTPAEMASKVSAHNFQQLLFNSSFQPESLKRAIACTRATHWRNFCAALNCNLERLLLLAQELSQ